MSWRPLTNEANGPPQYSLDVQQTGAGSECILCRILVDSSGAFRCRGLSVCGPFQNFSPIALAVLDPGYFVEECSVSTTIDSGASPSTRSASTFELAKGLVVAAVTSL